MKKVDFEGKNVYVVGGSTGIGLSVAKIMADLGANLIIFSRKKEKLEAALKVITTHKKGDSQRLTYKQLDVSIYNDVKAAMEASVQEFGTPDVLINCAGRAIPNYFQRIPYDQFDQTMRINLYGMWNTTSVLVPHMMKRGEGYIVNTSSVTGFLGTFGYTDYSASKFAVIGFSEALKSELASHGIKVSVLCPPDTDTPGFQNENKTKPPETAAMSENLKLMHPDDVARSLIRGMMKGKFIILSNFMSRLTYFLKRVAPWIIQLFINSDIRRARRKLEGKDK
jgi:3-dehydrosphinganine reductase